MKKFTIDVTERLQEMGYNATYVTRKKAGIATEYIVINTDGILHPSFNADEISNFTDNADEGAEYIDWLLTHEIETPQLTIDMHNYNDVKLHLKPVLLPERFITEQTSYVTAKPMGFDDLYLMIQITDIISTNSNCTGTTYVSSKMLEAWNVKFEEAFLDACDNYIDKVEIMPLSKKLEAMTGMPAEAFDNPMWVANLISQETYGASAVILGRTELEEHFPNGYIVIPSSIHEMLILPIDTETDELNRIITDVNENALDPKDILSDHYYTFK